MPDPKGLRPKNQTRVGDLGDVAVKYRWSDVRFHPLPSLSKNAVCFSRAFNAAQQSPIGHGERGSMYIDVYTDDICRQATSENSRKYWSYVQEQKLT